MDRLIKDQVISRYKHEVSVKKRKSQEFKKIGSINPKRGHNLWEINGETGEIRLADFQEEKNVSYLTALEKRSKKVVVKKDCVYISALNKDSAIKRFIDGKGSAQIGD